MRRYRAAPSISSGFVFISSRMFRANSAPRPKKRSPTMAHRMAAEWTVSARAFLSRAPKCRAVSTLTPPDMPMRNPVNNDTKMAVEPTEPRAMGPA